MFKSKFQFYRMIIGPATILILLLAIELVLGLYPDYRSVVTQNGQIPVQDILLTSILLTSAWLLIRLLDLFLWQGIVEKHIESKVPKSLKSIFNVTIVLLTMMIVVGYVFHQSLTGLIATTGMLGIVLGLGSRNTLESVFNGITLSVDPLFQIGDMVSLKGTFDAPARVIEMTWRYTILREAAGNYIIVPNTLICAGVVTNYSRPSHDSCFNLFFTVCVPNLYLKRIRKILDSAIRSSNSILSNPPPMILISDVSDASIKYQVQYWIDIRKVTPDEAKSDLYKNITHHFAIAGIGLEVTSTRYRDQAENLLTPAAVTEKVLKETKLFSELTQEEIYDLGKLVIVHSVKAGDVLIRQGESGESMFIIAEGLLKVEIEDEHHALFTLAKLIPGQYFGEMSLLVGEPRSAMVSALTDSEVYEINKGTMQHLFEAHPNLIKALSNKIAERHVANLKMKQEMSDRQVEADTRSYSELFGKMIKKWFWNEE